MAAKVVKKYSNAMICEKNMGKSGLVQHFGRNPGKFLHNGNSVTQCVSGKLGQSENGTRIIVVKK